MLAGGALGGSPQLADAVVDLCRDALIQLSSPKLSPWIPAETDVGQCWNHCVVNIIVVVRGSTDVRRLRRRSDAFAGGLPKKPKTLNPKPHFSVCRGCLSICVPFFWLGECQDKRIGWTPYWGEGGPPSPLRVHSCPVRSTTQARSCRPESHAWTLAKLKTQLWVSSHSLTHSLTHTLIHSLTHSLNHIHLYTLSEKNNFACGVIRSFNLFSMV